MDIRDLRFSECAYFYKLKNGMSISDDDIHNMLVQVTEGKIRRNYLFDIERQTSIINKLGCKFYRYNEYLDYFYCIN